MNKEKFKGLFDDAVASAVRMAEQTHHRSLSRNITIELHGAGHRGDRMAPSKVPDHLYLGPELFYQVIDIAVVSAGRETTTVFVRVTARPPVPFDQTWDPTGSGPFQPISAEELKPEGEEPSH